LRGTKSRACKGQREVVFRSELMPTAISAAFREASIPTVATCRARGTKPGEAGLLRLLPELMGLALGYKVMV